MSYLIFFFIRRAISTQTNPKNGLGVKKLSSETSHLVGNLLGQNTSYRRRNCCDLCFDEYAKQKKCVL